jgi:actin
LDKVVVLDLGSGAVKAGLANQPVPTFAEPSFVASAKSSVSSVMPGRSSTDAAFSIGTDALARLAVLDTRPLLHGGDISDVGDLREYLRVLLLDKMHLRSLEGYALVYTDSMGNPASTRTRVASILFEEPFCLSALCLPPAAVLALSASGLTTGLVVDVGHTFTTITPVFEGFVVQAATLQLRIAGADVTEQFATLLSRNSGIDFLSTASLRNAARIMKERYAYVASTTPEDERKKFAIPVAAQLLRKTHQLPDGTMVEIGEERFLSSEILFDPASTIGLDTIGLPELIAKAVRTCDSDIRRQLLRCVLLVGGTSTLPGLTARLERALGSLFPDHPVHVIDFAKRHVSAWIGGSMLASAPGTLERLLIYRDEWLSHGPSIVTKKYIM